MAIAERGQVEMSTNLDLLRAYAVVAVLADHVLETFGNLHHTTFHPLDWAIGRWGVLMFFVHTSLVLFKSLERHRQQGHSLWVGFYIRRIFRIYPLSIAVVIAAVLFRIPHMPWEPYTWRGLPNLVANLTMTQNLTFNEPILAPLWSLPIELQMYAMLPAIYIAYRRWPSTTFVVAMLIASVIAASVQPSISGRLSVLAYAPCFVGGLVAFHLSDNTSRRLTSGAWPIAITTLAIAYLGIQLLMKEIHPPTLGWAICVGLGLAIPQFANMRNPAVVMAGHSVARYSYGMYLLHIPILWLCMYVLNVPEPVQWALALCLIATLPVLAYRYIEAPCVVLGARLASATSRSITRQ